MPLKEKLQTLYKTYWNDPVWSKVIAAGITGILGIIFTLLWAGTVAIFQNISFGDVLSGFFALTPEIKTVGKWAVYMVVLILLYGMIRYIIIKKFTPMPEEGLQSRSIHEYSTSFFAARLASAFPGQRGLKWYESKTAIQRLKIVLKKPLRFTSDDNRCPGDPVWWYRGSSNCPIEDVEFVSRTKMIMDVYEININRMAVMIDDSYYKCFIYIEANPENNIFTRPRTDIEGSISYKGYANEEYGAFGKTNVTREEYDDGAALINGKVVDILGKTKLRVRYLSKYNFIIAAKQSPYNSKRFDRESKAIFNDILLGKEHPNALFQLMETFERHESMMPT